MYRYYNSLRIFNRGEDIIIICVYIDIDYSSIIRKIIARNRDGQIFCHAKCFASSEIVWNKFVIFSTHLSLELEF